MRCLVLAGALAVLAIAPVTAQTPSGAKKPWTAPRTPDGHPDLQGIWTNATITPIERPANFKDRPTLSEKEAHDYETRVSTQFNTDSRGANAEQDRDQAYNRLFLDRGDNLARVDGVALHRPAMVVTTPGKVGSLSAPSPNAPSTRQSSARRASAVRRAPVNVRVRLSPSSTRSVGAAACSDKSAWFAVP